MSETYVSGAEYLADARIGDRVQVLSNRSGFVGTVVRIAANGEWAQADDGHKVHRFDRGDRVRRQGR